MLKWIVNRIKQKKAERRVTICKAIIQAIRDIVACGQLPIGMVIREELRGKGHKVSEMEFQDDMNLLHINGFVTYEEAPSYRPSRRLYSLTPKGMMVYPSSKVNE